MRTHLWKENIYSELNKMKKMSSKDRLWYLWEYYKFHFFGILIFIGLIVSIGSIIHKNTYQTVLSCVYITPTMPSPQILTEPLINDFHNDSNLSEKELISAEHLIVSNQEQMVDMSYISMAKITALIAAKDLDIIIADRSTVKNYTELDGLISLEQALPAELLEKIADAIIYEKDSIGQLQPAAIDISKTKFASDSNLPLEVSYLSIISNTTHIDQCIALIDYIFDL